MLNLIYFGCPLLQLKFTIMKLEFSQFNQLMPTVRFNRQQIYHKYWKILLALMG